MNEQILRFIIMGAGGLFAIVLIAYFFISKKVNKKETKYIASLVEGTKQTSMSMDIFYQRFYLFCTKVPVFRRYVLKLRRRLEIINLDDEYLTRKQAAQIMFRTLFIAFPVTIFIILLTKSNTLLMSTLLLLEVFLIESIITGMVDKIDNNLLKQQIDMFSEIRHAYHETNMIEEAIYEVAQIDEVEVSRQAEKIYEVLISDDPEMELEKYYDIAPNSFLKEFAGISYLTKEFGDRKDKDGASLFLKNLNNITQEMQLEILKRDKLDYVFQSLSIISTVPILFLEPLKNWAISQFSFTKQFYNGKLGFFLQIAIIVLTFICYVLTRKLKDNGSVDTGRNMENPWEAKLYKKPWAKKIIDLFIPKQGTKQQRKVSQLLKEAASKLKIEWLYVDRITITIATFIVSMFVFWQVHNVTVNYVYTEPVSNYNLIGSMSASDEKKGMEKTLRDNKYLDLFRSRRNVTVDDIKKEMSKDKYYKDATEEQIQEDAERVLDKLHTIQQENFKWFELLLSFAFAGIGYYVPIGILMFQKRMRQMEMENEVMQFQTIILMLMKIERVNVEMILEWLERYSNIFRAPISKCVNNFESGSWEALEELKNDIAFPQLIRIVESLQSAVEKIPIRQAFDELDTERAYYQEKRKESNERLISRKGLIGKVIGFAPMVCLFVGYLIIPLCVIGLTSMVEAFNTMTTMM